MKMHVELYKRAFFVTRQTIKLLFIRKIFVNSVRKIFAQIL